MEESMVHETDESSSPQGQPQRRTVAAPAERVWDVLADGWTYANWVVGTARIRAVDEAWPAPGSRIHHSVGLWPALLSDTTRVEECDAGRRLLLTARGWPLGEARVEIVIEPDGPESCTVTITEDAVSGPGTPSRSGGTTTRRTPASGRWSATTTTWWGPAWGSPTTRTRAWRSSPGC